MMSQRLIQSATSRASILSKAGTQRYLSALPNTEILNSDEDNGILTLTLNRPKARNALSLSLLESLRHELQRAAEKPKDIRAIVVRGEGHVFSAGHDLKEMQGMETEQVLDLFNLCSEVMLMLSTIPQPTIGAVDGLATAAGCQLVAACDLAVGSPNSGYCTPGAKSIGLFCHTPAVPLVRAVGVRRALDMLYTGRVISADEALNYGLLTEIAEDPREAAHDLASQIAGLSTMAMQHGKATVYKQAGARSMEEAYEIASQAMVDNMKANDTKNGIACFLGKQKPEWKHE